MITLDTREKLLHSAKKLFARKGFDRVTVDEIVRDAGVAKGTFYLYFKRKEDIIREVAIMAMPFQALSDVFKPVDRENFRSLRDYLMFLGRKFFEHYSDRKLACIFFHTVSIKSSIQSLNDLHRELCSKLIKEGTRRVLEFVNIEEKKAEVLFRTFLGSLLHYLYSEDCSPIGHEEYLENLVQILTNSINNSNNSK
ncbi:TetR/AcrR family transcriptional regulator [Pyrococcus kukulkanii]|uniref:TetR/AcrR family transcriptional regulator n=1 Tax=Pyrococcus kukulkanii TaxID=1609559 RepID=UPI00356274E6